MDLDAVETAVPGPSRRMCEFLDALRDLIGGQRPGRWHPPESVLRKDLCGRALRGLQEAQNGVCKVVRTVFRGKVAGLIEELWGGVRDEG